MVYFGIQSKFQPFSGQILGYNETLNGISLPHQVIRNGHGDILLAKKFSGRLIENEVGKVVKVEPPKNDDYSRLIIQPQIGDLQGTVRAMKTFALGQGAFFVDLDIYLDEDRFVHVAFRPWPSQKRTMGKELCGKEVALENGELFILGSNGRRKAWPK